MFFSCLKLPTYYIYLLYFKTQYIFIGGLSQTTVCLASKVNDWYCERYRRNAFLSCKCVEIAYKNIDSKNGRIKHR